MDAQGPDPTGAVIGRSRQGRPLLGHRFGNGPLRINLVAGCHADEPVGPRLLQHLVRYLAAPDGHTLGNEATWTVIPHLNPDGAQVNRTWQVPGVERYDPLSFLINRVRELPGDDIEFGFPKTDDDRNARPENRAAYDFWKEGAPYDLHVSLHGMSVAAGPYFLVERSWWPAFEPASKELVARVKAKGYVLHDVERHGEKGFHRLAPGFCSRPDSRPMREHFMELGDPETASRFRPSSMEAIRDMSGDPLTLVTEMPLFLTPGVGAELGPPDPALLEWRSRIAEWEERLRSPELSGDHRDQVSLDMSAAGLVSMPVGDQMWFQWALICAGIQVVQSA